MSSQNQKVNLSNLILGFFVVGIIFISIVYFTKTFMNNTNNNSISEQSSGDQIVEQSSQQLIVQDLTVGTGKEAKEGNTLSVNYIGTLEDGTKFDSSYDRNQPFSFQLGAGNVIDGWDKGLVGMKEGGKRRLTIPPDMAYGARGQGSIPPNSTLIFEVELLKVEEIAG